MIADFRSICDEIATKGIAERVRICTSYDASSIDKDLYIT
jgi:hypothetical protein